METINSPSSATSPTSSSGLGQLYSDTKKSCDVVADEARFAQRYRDLNSSHLQFCIQREKLTAWSYEWLDETTSDSDAHKAAKSMDGAIAKAGLTEAVRDVLLNIKSVLEEAEQLKAMELSGSSSKRSWKPEHKTRYQMLANDLKLSVDLLYDLSRTRRELRDGTYPLTAASKSAAAGTLSSTSTKEDASKKSAMTDSEATLLNPSTLLSTKALSHVDSNTPVRLDPTLLELSKDEHPPPYDSIGATQPVRTMAYFKQQTGQKIPVLLEFAPFDPAYRATQLPPPTRRLDALLAFHAQSNSHADSQFTGLLPCFGFYEDPKHSRFALVYELPSTSSSGTAPAAPTTLLKLLQASSRMFNKDAKLLPNGPPLEDRFRMALSLVNTFFRLHTAIVGDDVATGLTHKEINSANVLFLPNPTTSHDAASIDSASYAVTKPFVASFDLFSEYNLERVHQPLSENIYRCRDDPKVCVTPCSQCRTETQPCKCNPIRFDWYSLALVLLEIGLWMQLADIFKPKYTLQHFKHRLDTIWVPKLASKCGSVYMGVVRDLLAMAVSSDLAITPASVMLHYHNWQTKLEKCCLIADASSDSLSVPMLPESSGNLHPKHKFLQQTALPLSIREDAARICSKIQIKTRRRAQEYERYCLWRGEGRVEALAASAEKCCQAIDDLDEELAVLQAERVAVAPTDHLLPMEQASHSSSQTETTALANTVSDTRSLSSTQKPIKTTLLIHNIKLQKADLDTWHHRVQPALERILTKALGASPESASIEIAMVGATPETAKPTVFVTCTSTSRVKAAVMKKYRCTQPNGEFEIKVRKGKIRRSKYALPHRSMVDENAPSEMALNPFYQRRPLCGASIGAHVGRHLPPVSFGGVVNVDGELFGMTVHHLVDDPSDDEDDERNDEHTQYRTHQDEVSSVATLRSSSHYANMTFEISDDEVSSDDDESADDVDDYYSDDEAEDEEDEDEDLNARPVAESVTLSTQGDIQGISIQADPRYLVTQPALDDVESSFFPRMQARDDDHLASHTLGHVHASSGIKRWRRNGILHEIDWALVKLREERLQPLNLIQGGRRFRYGVDDGDDEQAKLQQKLKQPVCRGNVYPPEWDEYPTRIKTQSDSSLPNLAVHCFGRTSGLAAGVIGPAMSSVRIYKRASFSRSWFVMGGEFGVGGDSGAWVIDNGTGEVVGHVLAWCERWQVAYICPADVLVEDMKRTLDAQKIGLPLGEDEEVPPLPLARPVGRMTAPAVAGATPSLGNMTEELARFALAREQGHLVMNTSRVCGQ